VAMDLTKFHNIVNDDGIILCINGIISQSIVVSVAQTLEQQLELQGVQQKIIGRGFTVIVEQMQNIMFYSSDRVQGGENKQESLGCTIAGFDILKKKYFVSSLNRFKTKNKQKISSAIEHINAMSSPDLKDFYREQRRSGRDKHEKGAGLGFIVMARNSSEPIVYSTHFLSSEQSVFEITTYL
jgi:hypothetical protein